jgi:hypothetical protein
MQLIPPGVQRIAGKLKQIPTGFQKLMFESKDVVVLYTKKITSSANNLRRREQELIRRNMESVQKLVVYFFLQLPPIIGILPTIVYLRYPRQLLTRHFWSDEEAKAYMVEEYEERRVHARKLADLIKDHSNLDISMYHLPSHLNTLPSHYIKTLAGANGIVSTQFILNWSPSFLLKMWLRTRAVEISNDDILLAKEGLNELTLEDLQLACLRRGLNPSEADGQDKLKSYLSDWVHSSLSKHCRTVPTTPHSLLNHATALPEIFLDKDKFGTFPLKEKMN